jgi:conjugative coupling factor TraD (TOL family)
MSNGYELDQRLRPAVEGYSATVAAACSAVAFTAPWALMLSPTLGGVAGIGLLGFAAYRGKQAWDILSYQYGCKNYKLTTVAPHRLPKQTDKLYLGQGFAWGQEHSQRKWDAASPTGRKILANKSRRLRPLMAPVRRFEKRAFAPTAQPGFYTASMQALARLTSKTALYNPVAPEVDLEGSTIIHGVEPKEVPIFLSETARNGHVLVLGTTRVGKTRLLELLATQDIHSGKMTVIIDPKGDADLMLRVYAECARAGRLDDFIMFHLGYPEISARYNGLGSFQRITEVATRATNPLPSAGNSAAFKEFSWRFSNLVSQATVALGNLPTHDQLMTDISNIEPLFINYAKLILNREKEAGRHLDWAERVEIYRCDLETPKNKPAGVPRQFQDRQASLTAMWLYVKDAKIKNSVLEGLAGAVSYEKSFYEKIIASLGPFLEKLTTGAVGKLLSPDYFDLDDPRPIFDWMTAIRRNSVVYIGLDALSDPVVAGAVGNTFLADLVSVAGKLYKDGLTPDDPNGKIVMPKLRAHFDELEACAGPEFLPLVNRGGGAGIGVTAYTQTLPDIEAKLGDKARAEQVIGNFNHIIMLRTRSESTAAFMTDQLPRVDIVTMTAVSGVTDTAADGNGKHFVSQNQDRIAKTKEPMLEPSDLMSLPKGQAFALIEGNRLYKIRIPLPDPANDAFVPDSLKDISNRMRKSYRTSENWAKDNDWAATLLQRVA